MTSLTLLVQLRALHHRLLGLVGSLEDADYRQQFHHDLSPVGWHLGHCLWIENYWLRNVLMEDDTRTRADAHYYQPQFSPKPERGPKLPSRDTLLDTVSKGFEDNILLLSGVTGNFDNHHALMADNYLLLFLLQHHSQHLETLRMVLTQRALSRHGYGFNPQTKLVPAPLTHDTVILEAGDYPIGGTSPRAFDNELAAGKTHIPTTRIARHPVSNAEYLSFIEQGGYRDWSHWDEKGQLWLETSRVEAPNHWLQDGRGWWYGISLDGPHELQPNDAVYGLNLHEAKAFSRWAGASLPHEFEWEAAARQGLLSSIGQVWEWCNNPFFPYEGFRAFPYEEYSTPWFDGTHHTLRGASRFTPIHTRRPSFRNFYTADKRHVFAGLRLVF